MNCPTQKNEFYVPSKPRILNPEIDPVSLEIQWQRLIAIMDEIDFATVKTSFSTIVGESRDFACILVDQNGDSFASPASHLPTSVLSCLELHGGYCKPIPWKP